jgi:hypothetical protein
MKTLIAIFQKHNKAIEAVKILKGREIPEKDLSLLGKTEIPNEDVKTFSDKILSEGPITAGVVIGPVLGVLAGVGVFAIPGLGFLFGAGALVGALAGLNLGLAGGGIVTLLTSLGVDESHHLKFEEHLKKGKVLLIAKGEKKTVDKAADILEDFNQHEELITY